MPYNGGKAGAGVYQRLINEMPPHSVYVEPFLGAGAVMRHKKPAPRSCGVEIDGPVLAAWIGDPVPGLKLYCCDGIEWLRHFGGFYRFGVDRERHHRSTDAAAKYSGNGRDRGGDVRRRTPNLATQASDDKSGGCRRRQKSWRDQVFVYCDPPYLRSTRRSTKRLYRHEMSEGDHVRLLETIVVLPFLVMISGYWSPLYASALEGWRTFNFQSMIRGGRKATEHVWMNYEPPGELHDYQFLGRDKRQRERIRKRRKRLKRGLAKLPPLERFALCEEVASVAANGDAAESPDSESPVGVVEFDDWAAGV